MYNFLLELKSMPAPSGFYDWTSFWMVILVSALNAVILLFVSYKFLQVVQLSGYKIKGYFAWLKASKCKDWLRLVTLSLLSSAALLITNVLLEQLFVYKIMTYFGLLFYLLFSIVYIINVYSAPQKTPLKYTKRMSRLCVVFAIVCFGVTFLVLTLSSKLTSMLEYIKYFDCGAVGLTPLLAPILVLVAYYLTLPIELIISNMYVSRAKKRIRSMKNLTVVGITGSYGKTSVKSILATMLAEKYKVCATPYSYNTPMGLSKTILGNLSTSDEIFIAEMGANAVGDIEYLTKMAPPDVAVITGIGNQHLATFGSKENLIATKEELVKNLKVGGRLFVNIESAGAKEIFDRAEVQKFAVSTNEKFEYYVEDVAVNENGSTFTVVHDGKRTKVQASLLGKHNISNILLCYAVASKMGVEDDKLAVAIRKLKAPAHRLAIVPSNNSITVIDDAFNGSVEGSKAALDVLASFAGQKIVITPGLVELGKDEFNCNFEFGKNMAKVADYVILNGVTNYEALSAGLEFGGFDKSKILRAGTLSQAVEVMNQVAKSGDVVLFENDLPDNYT